MQSKKQKIIIGAVVVIVLLSIYIIFDKHSKNNTGDIVPLNDNTNASTTVNLKEGITTDGSGGYTIEKVPIVETSIPKPIPDLTRKVVFGNSPSFTSEIKADIEKKVSNMQAELLKNPGYLEAWLDLGMYFKQAEDYNGAIIAWEYAHKLSPNDYISLGNLGNLYGYFLKDNGLAEVYYKEAISKGPTQNYLYVQLAELYRDVFKNMDKAKEIINQGLTKIPNDPNLLQFQATLK